MSMVSQISAFCRDVAKSKTLWTIQYEDGSYIKWCNEDGSEVFPLWSTESRVQRTLKVAEELVGGKPVSIPFDQIIHEWLQDIIKAGVAIGPNWGGENLTGTSFDAVELIERVKNSVGFHE